MRLGGRRPTNEWRAIAIGKDIAHERLCIDTSILVTGARWRKDRFVDLKVIQRSGGWSLSFLERMVRTFGGESIGCAV